MSLWHVCNELVSNQSEVPLDLNPVIPGDEVSPCDSFDTFSEAFATLSNN